ncbi:MAG: GatB/YqeY domain-containing protein [Henriciella sp.]
MNDPAHQSSFSMRAAICQALSDAEHQNPNSVQAQTLRLIKCALDDRDVVARARGDCSGCVDQEIVSLLETMVEQREASAAGYDDTGRIADADRERQEIEVIQKFLPRPLSGESLERAVEAVIADLEATKLKDVGRCMAALRARYPGQIECSTAGQAVRSALC